MCMWRSEIRLQWGRRQTSTESRHVRVGCPERIGASMGPPTNVDGELDRLMKGGAMNFASMGPPTNVDGESLVLLVYLVFPLCFNGAADKRRRRVVSRAPAATVAVSFNGAADKRRRRVHDTCIRSRLSSCFNGAADKRRRRVQPRQYLNR